MKTPINADLKKYIESEILPRYKAFDAAHQMDHVLTVINQSLQLAHTISNSSRYMNADGTKMVISTDMAYTIAAYHDTGLAESRETHHTASARIIREDKELLKWFTPEQIEVMAEAAEDHRASSKSEPRTIYGRIVAEADRAIDPVTIIRRTVQYGLSHYPELDKEGHYQRTIEHMAEKYAEGGYLKLWIPESPNAEQLAKLRDIIRNKERMLEVFEQQWENLTGESC